MDVNVKNNHDGSLGVGGVIVPGAKNGKPGVARVPNWDKVKRSHAVREWERLGLIEIEENASSGGLPGLPGLPGADDAEKEAIIAELSAKYGVTKTKRSSLDNLRQELEDQRKAANT